MANDFSGDGNCMALWRFEDGALTADSKGSNTLTPSGTPAADTVNYKEGAASCDFEEAGTPDRFFIATADLDAGYPFKLGDSTKKISICFWVKFESLPSSGDSMSLYHIGDTGTSNTTFYIVATNTAGTTAFQFAIGYNGGASWESVNHGTGISAGIWYHVAVTYQDSDKSYNMRIWDDNGSALLGGSEVGGNTTNNINIETDFVRIAHKHTGTSVRNPFDGLIDEMVLFNDILSSGEIDQIRGGSYNVVVSHWAKLLTANPDNIAVNEYCKFVTKDVIGRSYSEVKTDLGLGIGNSPQFTSIELGHATDTTLIRVSAGVVAVEGTNIAMSGGAFHDGFSDFDGNEHYLQSAITGVGTIATGVWEGTDVGITHGGTGQSTAQLAINALSAVGAATNEHVLTKDTGTGNAIWKVATGGGVAAHAILDGSVHTDSVADGVTRGSIIYGNATPKWDELVIGAADTFLGSDGTDLSYRTAAQVMASLSGSATAAFDLNGQDLTNGGVLFLTEQAAAEAHVAGKGQYWVKTATPNEPWFDNDAGTEIPLDNRTIDRGDPAAADWSGASNPQGGNDFHSDQNYHDLDLTAAGVPAGVISVLLRVSIKSPTVGSSISIRKNGNVNTRNRSVLAVAAANEFIVADMTVFPDSNGVVEYAMTDVVWTSASIVVGGWKLY